MSAPKTTDLDADVARIREAKGIVEAEGPKTSTRRKLPPDDVSALRHDLAPATTTAAALDAAQARRSVDEVNGACRDIALRAYFAGKLLNEMRARDAAKALGYGTWDAMVDAEIHVKKSTAYRWMQTAETFTEEQVRSLGETRAAILARATSERREALLPQATTMSTRQLEAEIKAIAPKPSDAELLKERNLQREEANARPTPKKETADDVAERETASLAARGRRTVTFCFEVDDEGVIVDTLPVAIERVGKTGKVWKERDEDAFVAKHAAARNVLVHDPSVDEDYDDVVYVMQDRNGRRLRLDYAGMDNGIRMMVEEPDDEDDDFHRKLDAYVEAQQCPSGEAGKAWLLENAERRRHPGSPKARAYRNANPDGYWSIEEWDWEMEQMKKSLARFWEAKEAAK